MPAKRKDVDEMFNALVERWEPKPAAPQKAPAPKPKAAATLDPALISRFIDALSAAETTVAAAQRQMAETQAAVAKPIEFPPDTSSDVIAAINAMRREIAAGLAKSATLAAADRVIVYDSLGTPRSRIAPQTGKV